MFISTVFIFSLFLQKAQAAIHQCVPPSDFKYGALFRVELKSSPNNSGPVTDNCNQIYLGLRKFISQMEVSVGQEQMRARLEDLASGNLADGKRGIHILNYPNVHSNNILAGLPYTSIIVSNGNLGGGNPPSLSEATHHEFGHLFFGVFNDALKEPISNLLRFGPEMHPRCTATTLALFELNAEGEMKDPFSLESAFSYRPAGTKFYCDLLARTGRDATNRTVRQSVEFQIAGSTGERPGKKPTEPIQMPTRQENPNETNSVVRTAYDCIGQAVQSYMIKEKGLGFEAYLKFYMRPTAETLKSLGINGFQDLQERIRASLNTQITITDAEKWKKSKRELSNFSCLTNKKDWLPDRGRCENSPENQKNFPLLLRQGPGVDLCPLGIIDRQMPDLCSQRQVGGSSPRSNPRGPPSDSWQPPKIDIDLKKYLGTHDNTQVFCADKTSQVSEVARPQQILNSLDSGSVEEGGELD